MTQTYTGRRLSPTVTVSTGAISSTMNFSYGSSTNRTAVGSYAVDGNIIGATSPNTGTRMPARSHLQANGSGGFREVVLGGGSSG